MGDALLIGGTGHTDLPTGDPKALLLVFPAPDGNFILASLRSITGALLWPLLNNAGRPRYRALWRSSQSPRSPPTPGRTPGCPRWRWALWGWSSAILGRARFIPLDQRLTWTVALLRPLASSWHSLPIFWSLVVVVAIKYLTLILRADNHGEVGSSALLALIPARLRDGRRGQMGWAAVLVIAGAALLYGGNGMITPAISVLSAMEGLAGRGAWLQGGGGTRDLSRFGRSLRDSATGTGAVGKLFGPVMVIWFLTLGVLGSRQIINRPEVLAALDPVMLGGSSTDSTGRDGILVVGSVALDYRRRGAGRRPWTLRGRTPIRVAWFALAMPALVLNYFGQGALILGDPHAIARPFFEMVPAGAWTYALVALSGVATVIASQALISGAFSLTHQAVQLGFFPFVTIKHTSRDAEGQIYIPEINWGLAVACVALVLTFREKRRLAAAYGLAVTGTMAITSVIYFEVTRTTWRWPLWKALPILVLLFVDLPFFTATLFKFPDGGFVPVLIGLGFFTVMFTCKRGWTLYRDQLAGALAPLDRFVTEGAAKGVTRVPGTGVFVTRELHGVPPVLSDLVTRIRVLPQRVVLLSVATTRTPRGTDTRLDTLAEQHLSTDRELRIHGESGRSQRSARRRRAVQAADRFL